MLQTQVFQSFTQRPPKGLLKFGALAVTVGGGYGAYWHYNSSLQLQQRYNAIDQAITEWQPFALECANAVSYPWAQDDSLNEWEFRLVKMYGYFRV